MGLLVTDVTSPLLTGSESDHEPLHKAALVCGGPVWVKTESRVFETLWPMLGGDDRFGRSGARGENGRTGERAQGTLSLQP